VRRAGTKEEKKKEHNPNGDIGELKLPQLLRMGLLREKEGGGKTDSISSYSAMRSKNRKKMRGKSRKPGCSAGRKRGKLKPAAHRDLLNCPGGNEGRERLSIRRKPKRGKGSRRARAINQLGGLRGKRHGCWHGKREKKKKPLQRKRKWGTKISNWAIAGSEAQTKVAEPRKYPSASLGFAPRNTEGSTGNQRGGEGTRPRGKQSLIGQNT